MKVLVLAPHPFFAQRGTPIAVKALLEVLVAQGHRLTVLTYHEGEALDLPGCEILRIPAIPGIHGVRPGFSVQKLVCDAALALKCLLLVRRERFDLVHAVEESAFIALALRWLYRVPYVYDMDSSLAQQMIEKYPSLGALRALLEACERQAVRGSEAVLAVCKALEDTALGHAPAKPVARVEDVSLLVPTEGPVEDLAATIGSAGPVVLYVGNLEKYQGIDLLVRAFALAGAEVPEARLVVIGGAEPDIRYYRGLAADLGLDTRAHFLGPRPVERLADYLGQAAVLVSPRTQGMNTAMKVYSYLDSGRPLLATLLPTHTQVLDDGIAWLAEPEPRAMARGMVELLRDEPLRRRLAAAARERVREEFSPEAFRRKVESFYDGVERRLEDRRVAEER